MRLCGTLPDLWLQGRNLRPLIEATAIAKKSPVVSRADTSYRPSDLVTGGAVIECSSTRDKPMETTHELVSIEQPEATGELNRRELFAAMALQGILAGRNPNIVYSPEETAQIAVTFADALIQALHR